MTEQPQVPGLDRMAAPDQIAIGQTLGTFMAGFQGRQADVLTSVYTEDVDWANAFGTVLHGRDTVVEYLRGLFADDNVDQGQPAGPPDVALRTVTDDVVVVTTHLRIQGQGTGGGGEIECATTSVSMSWPSGPTAPGSSIRSCSWMRAPMPPTSRTAPAP